MGDVGIADPNRVVEYAGGWMGVGYRHPVCWVERVEV